MQCDEVIKELATPTDHRDSTALADHIAGCPVCADWAICAVQLDRLWEATRPIEPTPGVWDAVWARMASSLDPSTSTELESTGSLNGSPHVVEIPLNEPRHSPRSRPWHSAAIGLGLAQAAAIFLAVGLAWHQSDPHRPRGGRLPRLPLRRLPSRTRIRSFASPFRRRAFLSWLTRVTRLLSIGGGRSTRLSFLSSWQIFPCS